MNLASGNEFSAEGENDEKSVPNYNYRVWNRAAFWEERVKQIIFRVTVILIFFTRCRNNLWQKRGSQIIINSYWWVCVKNLFWKFLPSSNDTLSILRCCNLAHALRNVFSFRSKFRKSPFLSRNHLRQKTLQFSKYF